MKKILFFAWALFAIMGAYAQVRIAVFPFDDLDNVLTRNQSISFYQEFSNEFATKNAGRFDVLPRGEVEKLFNLEAKFQLSDLSARVKTAEMQKALNGRQILSGLIVKIDNNIRITVSLYSYPELVQRPGGTSISVANVNQLFEKIPELVQKMQNRMAGAGMSGGTDRLVFVEGGIFTMGPPTSEYSNDRDEGQQHQVTVSSFYMGKYVITLNEFREVMGSGRGRVNEFTPVNTCTWYRAIEFCNKLSIKEGLTPCYRGIGDNIICDWSANGYRLPTEAEWEYAAKGGNKDLLVYRYSGSNNPDDVAWYAGNTGKSDTRYIGTKNPNSLGIYDMSGLVSEWCWDWYADYTSHTKINPHGPDSAYSRVLRGGSQYSSERAIQCTSRGYNHPAWTYYVGFRVVRRF